MPDETTETTHPQPPVEPPTPPAKIRAKLELRGDLTVTRPEGKEKEPPPDA